MDRTAGTVVGFYAVYPAEPGESLGIVIADDEDGARAALDAVGLYDGSGESGADDCLRVVAVELVTRAHDDELATELVRALGGAGCEDGARALLEELERWGLVQREGHAVAVYRPAALSLGALRLILEAGLERAHHDAEVQRAIEAHRAAIATAIAAAGAGVFPWGA